MSLIAKAYIYRWWWITVPVDLFMCFILRKGGQFCENKYRQEVQSNLNNKGS